MDEKNNFKILGIDHIGIATTSLDAGSEFWKLIGLVSNHPDELVEDQGVKIRFFEFDNLEANHIPDPRIELLEPTSDDTPIGKFISKRGEGIQQICLEVDGLASLLEHLKSKGIILIDDVPRKGANGALIAFVHPKSTGGVLVELSEH